MEEETIFYSLIVSNERRKTESSEKKKSLYIPILILFILKHVLVEQFLLSMDCREKSDERKTLKNEKYSVHNLKLRLLSAASRSMNHCVEKIALGKNKD